MNQTLLAVFFSLAIGAFAAAWATAPVALPAAEMQSILQAKGSVSNGVLSVDVPRKDIANVRIGDVPITPALGIDGELTFQPLADGQAFFNGDLALRPEEIGRVIDAIVQNGLQLQAEHQHMYDFQPMVWFIHLRGTGEPLALARAVHQVLAATAVPLPSQPAANPTTPLDAQRLKRILHGFDASVEEDGVVVVKVARRQPVTIAGLHVDPRANIATHIGFQPLGDGRAAVLPDFGMTADEINAVVGTMRSQGWDIGCLYNQETDEQPQLYFSHQFKVGDPYLLAQELRNGLDHMAVQ